MNVDAFNKQLKELYLPSDSQFSAIDVPEINYLAIDGAGSPDSESFNTAVKWLFSVSHMVKPAVKQRMGKNFVEPPLECLFWADNEKDFVSGNKDKWRWRAMIVFVPDLIPPQLLQESIKKVEKKLGSAPDTLRYQPLHEGESIQIMHIGDYSEIRSVCDELYNEFLPANNLQPCGYYHEIYLNDPNRVAPGKRKTVIRQPVSQR